MIIMIMMGKGSLPRQKSTAPRANAATKSSATEVDDALNQHGYQVFRDRGQRRPEPTSTSLERKQGTEIAWLYRGWSR